MTSTPSLTRSPQSAMPLGAPVGGDQPGRRDLVDVALERQGDDVGLEPVDHCLGLLARAAVALLDGDVVAGGLVPVLREGRVELLVELARRIVGDIEQGLVGGAGRDHSGQRQRGHKATQGKKHGSSLHHLSLVKNTWIHYQSGRL